MSAIALGIATESWTGYTFLAVATGLGLFAFRADSAPARLFVDPHAGSYYSPANRPIQPVFSSRGDRLLTLIHVPDDAVSFGSLFGLGTAIDEGEQLATGGLEVAEAAAD